MSLRVDALPGKRSAFAVLGRALLSPTPDEPLQRIVEKTAMQLAMPMAIVSIVLEHIELFKAQHGLSPELAAVGAVGRDEAFCQYVVRDRDVVQLDDPAAHPELPQEMVERHGVRSYLGDVVVVEGEAVGTLCVMDRRPRRFTDRDRALIRRGAADASARMTELARSDKPPPGALRDRAVRPQFAELRNRLQPTLYRMTDMQIALAEIRAVHRMAQYVAIHPEKPVDIIRLDAAQSAIDDLSGALDAIYGSVTHIEKDIEALESATLLAREPCSIRHIVDTAATLAHHETKLVGGVRLPSALPDIRVLAPRAVAVNALAAVLSCVSHRAHDAQVSEGIGVAIAEETVVMRVRVTADKVTEDELDSATAALGPLMREAPFVAIAHETGAIEVAFTRM
jgi:hypothetical protein